MTKLTKGNQTFKWNDEAEASFQRLKNCFKQAPLLAHFDPKRKITMEADASGFALAVVLSQIHDDGHKHPVAFYSRKFIDVELNYGIGDQELLAIVEGFRHFRHFVEGALHKVTVITDHDNLKYFLTTKTLTRRQARWSERLSTIDFEIIHRPGKRNPADGPSRRADYKTGLQPAENNLRELLHSGVTIMEESRESTSAMLRDHDEVMAMESNSNHGLPMEKSLREQVIEAQRNRKSDDKASYYNDVIYIQGDKVWIPEEATELVRMIISQFHDTATAGHFGRDKTLASIKKYFRWKGMDNDVAEKVKTCPVCQITKPMRTLPNGELMPIPLPHRPWESISVDFITQLPTSKATPTHGETMEDTTIAFDAICVVVCRFSKRPVFIPCHTTMTAYQFAHLMIRHVFSKHGFPESIISDRDSLFTSYFWQAICDQLKIERRMSTAFHPQTDGQTERMNAVLEQYLRAYINYQQNDWADWLSLAEFAISATPSSTTKMTPFEACGEAIIPWSYHGLTKTNVQSADELAEKFEVLKQNLTDKAIDRQNTQARYYDAKHSKISFVEGQLVLLSTKNIKTNRPSKKLDNRWIGPFTIENKIGEQSYRLKLPKHYKIHPVFHVQVLKRYTRGDIVDPPPPEMVFNEEYGQRIEEHEVEEVLDSRIYRKKIQYLVHWRGWPSSENAWESARNLTNAQRLVDHFHRKHPGKPRP